jgi:hypothetical protein
MKPNNATDNVNNTLEFVYCNKNLTKWRIINAIKEDNEYIYGFDLESDNDYKAFKKSKILGGKIFSFRG